MKRILVVLALFAPALALVFFYLVPQADLTFELPIQHFYVVTFTTFAAGVLSILITISLGDNARPRHILGAAAFAVIGSLFFSHGLTTPGAIIVNFHPAIQWSAWLTLFGGGVMFVVASLDGPQERSTALPVRPIVWLAVSAVLVYSAIAGLAPHLLSLIDQDAAPWHRFTIFALTLVLWLVAAFRLWQTWRVTHNRVDGSLAFVALWLAWATVSMHLFPVYHLSWWIYHFALLGAFLVSAVILVTAYEQARQFRVQRYYLSASLILTALLALVASHLFAEFSYRTLVAELEANSAHLVDSVSRSVAAGLPPNAPAEEVRSEFIGRIAGEVLAMDELYIYDLDGAVLYPAEAAGQHESDGRELANFGQALRGETLVTIRPPNDPPPDYVPSAPVHIIETYTAIPNTSAPVGVLVTMQEAPELNQAIVRGRATGLGIAALTMGLLFVALLLVVHRADHIITTRADELRTAYTSLREAEGMRDDLTNMIVHDLRTPLSVITASLEMLTRRAAEQQAEARARYVQTANVAGRRMTGLIDDLLNVAQIEAGETKPRLQPISILALFEECLNDFSVQAAADGRQLSLDCAPEVSARLDPDQVGRVLTNLVANAFKYTDKGGSIRASAWADPAAGRIYFSVRDDGQGIPDQYKTRIFDKFVRVPEAEGRQLRKGTGIGLSFCRLVVQAHGGQIWVEDAPGGGSEFKFWVPLGNA